MFRDQVLTLFILFFANARAAAQSCECKVETSKIYDRLDTCVTKIESVVEGLKECNSKMENVEQLVRTSLEPVTLILKNNSMSIETRQVVVANMLVPVVNELFVLTNKTSSGLEDVKKKMSELEIKVEKAQNQTLRMFEIMHATSRFHDILFRYAACLLVAVIATVVLCSLISGQPREFISYHCLYEWIETATAVLVLVLVGLSDEFKKQQDVAEELDKGKLFENEQRMTQIFNIISVEEYKEKLYLVAGSLYLFILLSLCVTVLRIRRRNAIKQGESKRRAKSAGTGLSKTQKLLNEALAAQSVMAPANRNCCCSLELWRLVVEFHNFIAVNGLSVTSMKDAVQWTAAGFGLVLASVKLNHWIVLFAVIFVLPTLWVMSRKVREIISTDYSARVEVQVIMELQIERTSVEDVKKKLQEI